MASFHIIYFCSSLFLFTLSTPSSLYIMSAFSAAVLYAASPSTTPPFASAKSAFTPVATSTSTSAAASTFIPTSTAPATQPTQNAQPAPSIDSVPVPAVVRPVAVPFALVGSGIAAPTTTSTLLYRSMTKRVRGSPQPAKGTLPYVPPRSAEIKVDGPAHISAIEIDYWYVPHPSQTTHHERKRFALLSRPDLPPVDCGFVHSSEALADTNPIRILDGLQALRRSLFSDAITDKHVVVGSSVIYFKSAPVQEVSFHIQDIAVPISTNYPHKDIYGLSVTLSDGTVTSFCLKHMSEQWVHEFGEKAKRGFKRRPISDKAKEKAKENKAKAIEEAEMNKRPKLDVEFHVDEDGVLCIHD